MNLVINIYTKEKKEKNFAKAMISELKLLALKATGGSKIIYCSSDELAYWDMKEQELLIRSARAEDELILLERGEKEKSIKVICDIENIDRADDKEIEFFRGIYSVQIKIENAKNYIDSEALFNFFNENGLGAVIFQNEEYSFETQLNFDLSAYPIDPANTLNNDDYKYRYLNRISDFLESYPNLVENIAIKEV